MVTELHRKIFVAEAALDFDTNFAAIDSLAAGSMCWNNPIVTMEDCDFAEVFAQIKAGATTPAGTIEFYAGRAGSNLRSAEGYGNTLTDHGTEATAADVARMLQGLPPPVKVITCDETADVVYTCSFRVWYPGADWNLFIYNNTDEAFNGTSSPHSVYARGWGPELQ
jgi:hypothetical protein